MRKVIFTLLLLMLTVVQAVPAAAQEVTQFSITASAQEAKPGDEITFTVTIHGEQSCRYYGVMLEYDPAVYEMGKGKCTVDDAMLSDFDPARGFVVLNEEELVPQGTLGTFTMKIREDAPVGNAEVTGVSAVKTGDETKESVVTGANVNIQKTAVPPATEATVPETTESSGSQSEKVPQSTKPSSTKPSTTKPAAKQPAATKPAATAPVETIPETVPVLESAVSAPAAEVTTTGAVPEDAAVEETVSAQQDLQDAEQQTETSNSLVPILAVGAAVLCLVLLIVLVARKRKP